MLLLALFVSGSAVAYLIRRTLILPALLAAVVVIVVLRKLPPIRLKKDFDFFWVSLSNHNVYAVYQQLSAHLVPPPGKK